MDHDAFFRHLAEEYPQLYLNPDADSQEQYRDIVSRGNRPATSSLALYHGSPLDRDVMIDTPVGPIRAVTLGYRRDYELFMRNMMAAKEGPKQPVPASQGAAMLIAFNWPRIHRHLAEYAEAERAAGHPDPDTDAEFRRFISDKKNYQDMLVVLSTGPYSNVSAEAAGRPETEWRKESGAIRLYHEVTHVICRTRYPDRVDAVWDELVADSIGIYGAYRKADPDLIRLFLGIRDGAYAGGRLENYTKEPERIAGAVSRALDEIGEIVEAKMPEAPFDLIDDLQGIQRAF